MDISAEHGWRCCSMHDPSGRRGIWYRTTETGELRIVAGREGDDAEVLIPKEFAKPLADCLSYGAWMQEDYGPGLCEPSIHDRLAAEFDRDMRREQ